MDKKGQVSIFIILGLLLVVIVVLVLLARQTGIGVEPKKFLSAQAEPINKKIGDCTVKEGLDVLRLLGLQGGDLNPTKYLKYKDYNVAFLCYNQKNEERCIARGLTKREMEQELENYLNEKLLSCISVKEFWSGYDISTGELTTDVTIGNDIVFINVIYPITLRKGDSEIKLENFPNRIEVPLGRLFDVVQDILWYETENGLFFVESYELLHQGEFEIRKDQPYPQEIYILRTRTSDYIFQFAVEGEPYVDI